MNEYKDNIDLIERYLEEDLSPGELELFNEKLKHDRAFSQLFYDMDVLMDGIRQSAVQTSAEEKLARLEQSLPVRRAARPAADDHQPLIRGWLGSINQFLDRLFGSLLGMDQEEMRAVPVGVDGRYTGWSMATKVKLTGAVAIVLIAVAGILLVTRMPGATPFELYASNYEKPVLNEQGFRSTAPEIDRGLSGEDLLKQANFEYNRANYGKAIQLLETVPDEEKTPGMLYAAALSHMETEAFGRAIELLTRLGREEDIIWKERANWFVALCYLRDDETGKAKEALKIVADIPGGQYQQHAAGLLRKIDRIQ